MAGGASQRRKLPVRFAISLALLVHTIFAGPFRCTRKTLFLVVGLRVGIGIVCLHCFSKRRGL